MKKILFLSLLLTVVFSACRDKPLEPYAAQAIVLKAPPTVNQIAEKSMDVEVEEPIANGNANQVTETKPSIEAKIIKEGDIRFETANVVDTRKQIIESLKHYGGYAEEDTEITDGDAGSKEYKLTIRIPAKNFDKFLGKVSSTATKIDSRSIQIKDVTTQFIDTKTRLDNKLQLEKRYLNLLNRAGKMRDLLDIEEKLTQIRSEIESTQSQLNYMSKQVEYSSLTITFYTRQPEQVNTGNGFGYRLSHAMANGWDWLQDLFFSLIAHWPLLLTLTALGLVLKRWRSRRKLAKQA